MNGAVLLQLGFFAINIVGFQTAFSKKDALLPSLVFFLGAVASISLACFYWDNPPSFLRHTP
jgi:hypothetical protein